MGRKLKRKTKTDKRKREGKWKKRTEEIKKRQVYR